MTWEDINESCCWSSSVIIVIVLVSSRFSSNSSTPSSPSSSSWQIGDKLLWISPQSWGLDSESSMVNWLLFSKSEGLKNVLEQEEEDRGEVDDWGKTTIKICIPGIGSICRWRLIGVIQLTRAARFKRIEPICLIDSLFFLCNDIFPSFSELLRNDVTDKWNNWLKYKI